PVRVTLAPERRLGSTPGEETELAAGDLDVSFYSGDAIDLAIVLEDELLLMLPELACEETEDGECTVCGRQVDQGLAPEAPDEAVHPLAGLRSLMREQDEK